MTRGPIHPMLLLVPNELSARTTDIAERETATLRVGAAARDPGSFAVYAPGLPLLAVLLRMPGRISSIDRMSRHHRISGFAEPASDRAGETIDSSRRCNNASRSEPPYDLARDKTLNTGGSGSEVSLRLIETPRNARGEALGVNLGRRGSALQQMTRT